MFYTLCVCVCVTIESLRPGDMTYASLWWELLLCLMQNESQEEENSALKGRAEAKEHRHTQSKAENDKEWKRKEMTVIPTL